MNQLDIPPISFARYVDLLKRRRWQVIPTSIAGLLVGAIVALVIPRYYVAKTTITYKGGAFDKARGTAADPLFAKVSNAKLTIPVTLEKTLESLNLIGTNPNDPDRQDLIAAWSARVDINSFSFDAGQSYYNIEIVVRDRDGPLSKLVADKLRSDWIASIMRDLELEANTAAQSIMSQVAQVQQSIDQNLQDLELLRAQYDIQPDKDPTVWKEDERRFLSDEIRENAAAIEELKRAIAEQHYRIELIREELSDMRPQIPVDQAPAREDPERARLLAELQRRLIDVQQRKGYYNKPELIRNCELEEKSLLEQINRLTGITDTGKQELIPNPAHLAKLSQQHELERETARNVARLESLQRRALDLDARKVRLNDAFTEYDRKRQERDSLLLKKQKFEEDQLEQEQRSQRAKLGRPFDTVDAVVPPAPTEPGFLLVALAGSIVGLGAAIGFVLLGDFLRATFKTVDDVGYALGVPILGVMAHLETAEQRARSVSRRRRMTLVAASFVVLSLSLVTVYYTKPTSLPSWVVQALDRVLGTDASPTGATRR